MNSLELLKAGRALLVSGGWCRGIARVDGRHCMVAALYHTLDPMSIGIGVTAMDIYSVACNKLRASLPDPEQTLAYYNDDIAVSFNQILAVYDRAIELEEAAEMHRELEQSSSAAEIAKKYGLHPQSQDLQEESVAQEMGL